MRVQAPGTVHTDMKSDRRRATARSLRLALVLALLIQVTGGATGAGEITGDHRLFRSFIEDGAIVQVGWLELAVSYTRQDAGRDLLAESIASFRVGEEFEAGFILGLLDRRREAGDMIFGAPISQNINGAGLADPRVFAKYRLLRSPVEMSVGAIATLPLGEEERGRGAGSLRYEAFLGLRKRLTRVTLIGSAALKRHDDSEGPGAAEGNTTARIGIGAIVPLTRIWVLIAEATYEGAPYGDEDDPAVLLLGLDWRPTENLAIRGAVAAGLTDPAPDLHALLSAAFNF